MEAYVATPLNGMFALEERSLKVIHNGHWLNISDANRVESDSNDTDTVSSYSGEDDKELLYDKEEASAKHKEKVALGERVVPFLRLNWRNLVAIVCLWISMLMVNAALSMMAPFFPQEVYSSLRTILRHYTLVKYHPVNAAFIPLIINIILKVKIMYTPNLADCRLSTKVCHLLLLV